MSVIVKGMEMPVSGTKYRVVEGLKGNKYLTRDGFFDGLYYPINPLPEKHGRLGDLDELQALFRECIDECKKWIKELEENGDNETLPLANQAFCTFVEAALRLKSIPTIVEAEGK